MAIHADKLCPHRRVGGYGGGPRLRKHHLSLLSAIRASNAKRFPSYWSNLPGRLFASLLIQDPSSFWFQLVSLFSKYFQNNSPYINFFVVFFPLNRLAFVFGSVIRALSSNESKNNAKKTTRLVKMIQVHAFT